MIKDKISNTLRRVNGWSYSSGDIFATFVDGAISVSVGRIGFTVTARSVSFDIDGEEYRTIGSSGKGMDLYLKHFEPEVARQETIDLVLQKMRGQ